MAKIKTVDEAIRNYVYKSLKAFLEGRMHLNWIREVIRNSGIEETGTTLVSIFESLRGCGDNRLYDEVRLACRQEGLLR